MELKSSRKYNTDFRKKLVAKFENIKNKCNYFEIYDIIIDDIGNNFSSNRNGIFINMNLLSDKCIKRLIEFIDDKFNLNITCSENDKNHSSPKLHIKRALDLENQTNNIHKENYKTLGINHSFAKITCEETTVSSGYNEASRINSNLIGSGRISHKITNRNKIMKNKVLM